MEFTFCTQPLSSFIASLIYPIHTKITLIVPSRSYREILLPLYSNISLVKPQKSCYTNKNLIFMYVLLSIILVMLPRTASLPLTTSTRLLHPHSSWVIWERWFFHVKPLYLFRIDSPSYLKQHLLEPASEHDFSRTNQARV